VEKLTERDVGELLFDVTVDLALGGRGERVAALRQDLHQVVGEITAGEVETEGGMQEHVTFVDGHGVRDTVTAVEDDASGTARGTGRAQSGWRRTRHATTDKSRIETSWSQQ